MILHALKIRKFLSSFFFLTLTIGTFLGISIVEYYRPFDNSASLRKVNYKPIDLYGWKILLSASSEIFFPNFCKQATKIRQTN